MFILSRGTELFQVLLNVGAGQQATFVLQYQQLLTRYQHKYATTVNLNPGCIVDHINVTITAYEEQGIDQESIGKSDFASILEQSETSVSVEYTPTIEDQKSFGDTGLASDLFFEYDVVHKELDPGLILFKDGYFVHFFSPTGLPVLLVSIVFVVDVSGSMGGEKIMQARESLKAIIPQLNNEDYIGIVKFDGTVSAWQNDVVSVEEFHAEAINYVTQLEAGGSTNLNDAVITGVNILKRSSSSTHSRILVLLTDGQPTAGEVNTDRIIQNSISVVGDSGVSINCLGFGFDLDYNLLERLAINNNGIVHRIYTGQDATEQLQGFYQEVTAPLLAQISFDYPLEIIEFVTAINFPYLFSGGEIVIAGKFEEGQTGLIPINVTAYGIIDSVVFRGTINTDITSDYPLEQLVAYYRIQQLLESRNKEGVNDTIVEQEALEIALKYNFVTELTSLIVVQDQGNSTSNDTAFPDYGDGSDYEDEEDRTFFNHPPAGLPPATTTSTNPSAASGEASPMLPSKPCT